MFYAKIIFPLGLFPIFTKIKHNIPSCHHLYPKSYIQMSNGPDAPIVARLCYARVQRVYRQKFRTSIKSYCIVSVWGAHIPTCISSNFGKNTSYSSKPALIFTYHNTLPTNTFINALQAISPCINYRMLPFDILLLGTPRSYIQLLVLAHPLWAPNL